MYDNPYGSSLETQVLAATPMELVEMLFDAAVKSVSEARRHLAAGRIMERSRAASKTVEILTELSRSLDHQAGGELSTRLAALYEYIGRRIQEANFEQTDGGLAEAEGLLRTLHQGWSGALASQAVTATAASSYSGSGAHQWSA
jgi:flagellar protein FliS